MYDVLDGFFSLPSLLVGINQRIWERPDAAHLRCVRNHWASLGLFDTEGRLTKKGHEVAEDGEPMVNFYLAACGAVLEHNYDGNVPTRITPDAKKHQLLALDKYYQRHMSGRFWTHVGNVQGLMLDLGGGAGSYSEDWQSSRKNRSAISIDIEPPLRSVQHSRNDIVQEGWELAHSGQASIVLLSEVLCLFDGPTKYQLIGKAKTALRPGGMIVINERNPTNALSWILSVTTENGSVLGTRDVAELMTSHGMCLQTSVRPSTNHHTSVWKLN